MDNKVAKVRPRRDWWQRGRAFDLWSIPHFLFGALAGMLPSLTQISILSACALMFMLAVLWEWYEKIIGIKETVLNIAADFVLPALAFVGVLFFLHMHPLYGEDILVLFIATLLLYGYTNISGWLAYRRRSRDFSH